MTSSRDDCCLARWILFHKWMKVLVRFSIMMYVYVTNFDYEQHGSPASPMRSIRGSITIAAAPSNSNGGGSNINNNNFFEGHRFVVSGIPEKLK